MTDDQIRERALELVAELDRQQAELADLRRRLVALAAAASTRGFCG